VRGLAAIGALALAGCGGGGAAAKTIAPPPADVSCREGGPAMAAVAGRDAQIGPLTILFARRTVRQRRDAFDGHGWKLPVTLPADVTATLSVPPELRGHVGLAFTQATQRRVWRRGVRAADQRLTFQACGGEGPTGWPGGIVAEPRLCATLRVGVAGQTEPIERRVPLGKRCRP
jgi:hypothetical protein